MGHRRSPVAPKWRALCEGQVNPKETETEGIVPVLPKLFKTLNCLRYPNILEPSIETADILEVELE